MKLSILSLFLFATLSGFAQHDRTFSKIDIKLIDHTLREVAALGLEVDHGMHKPHKSLINVYDERELALLDNAGIPYEIIIEDVYAFYQQYGTTDEKSAVLSQREQDCEESFIYEYETPENYEFGNMGGYLSYAEALANMDKMHELYPDLISERIAIDSIETHEGRYLHYMVISTEPENVDTDKPQVFYNALHHAREPNSLSNLLFYMWYLLENYGQDEEITYLVDNTTMFFLPIVNPDGYVFNEVIAPRGGGLWRKNMFLNAEGDTVGVDLNRNYDYFYAFDDEGSSPLEEDQTYRGLAAFSEPELQAMKALCEANEFQIALNYHTHGNLLIHPWGYSDMPTSEDVLFKSMGNVMTADNDFVIGTGTETVGYTVNGNSDDWMYGELQTKNKIYSLTPEIGPAFWPGEWNIDQLNKSVIRHNLNAAHLLFNYGWVTERFALNEITSANGTLFFELEKSGLKEGDLSLSFTSPTPGVTVTYTPSTHTLSAGETVEVQFEYAIDENLLQTATIEFVANMSNGDITIPITFSKTHNLIDNMIDPEFSFSNNLDSIDAFEVGDSEWGLTDEDFFSAPFSITDSPGRRYSNNTESEIYLTESLSTDNLEQAYLRFQTKFEIEPDFDYVQIQVSMDGGEYLSMCGELTKPASQFPDGRPLYDGAIDWTQETICLNDFLSAEQLNFRFIFFSDQGLRLDGFYFDDLTFDLITDGESKTENVEIDFLTVSPNPTNDKIRISMPPQRFKKNFEYSVFNITGELMAKGAIERPQIFVDLDNYVPGNYMIQITENNRVITNTKFVKN